VLSVRKIQYAKPGKHCDGHGLYLLVKPSGAKSWLLRVQHQGRRRDFGLGTAITGIIDVDIPLQKRRSLTLAQAREKARIARELSKSGMDPTALWREQEDSIPSFKKVAVEYHGHVSKGWRNGKHSDQWLTTLKIYAFPVIGELPVDAIDARSIQRVLAPIWLQKGETARRVRQRVAAVLDYAHGKGWRETEAPMRAVNQLLGGIKQPRSGNFAAMPYRELPAFMAKLRAGDHAIGRSALQFLILTAARSGEIRKARWSEIDFKTNEWRVPPGNTKTERLHIVPLDPSAIAILNETRAGTDVSPDDLVFPGMRGTMSDATLSKVLRKHGGGAFTVHGFRSAFRDWAAENGFPDGWAEAALAHTNPNRVESAYRRTTFFEQRRDTLMPSWATFVLEAGRDSGRVDEARSDPGSVSFA
jgi:integrase